MSNIKAEHSQMVMTNSKKKPVDSKFDEQAAESGRAPHHISPASEGHASGEVMGVQTWVLQLDGHDPKPNVAGPSVVFLAAQS